MALRANPNVAAGSEPEINDRGEVAEISGPVKGESKAKVPASKAKAPNKRGSGNIRTARQVQP